MPITILRAADVGSLDMLLARGPARFDPARPSAAVVAIPVHDAYDDVVACLEAVLRHTPRDVTLLVLDDGSRDPRIAGLCDAWREVEHDLVLIHDPINRGFVHTANRAFTLAARRDVVLLNSDVIVGADWLPRLCAAAYSDARIATATALTNHGTILSIPRRNQPGPLPEGLGPDEIAARVAGSSGLLRPRIPTCVGHCVYVKRLALDLVGGFDVAFSPGYGEEVDFSQRCVRAGLTHVCADDVFVFHRGSGSFGQSDAARALKAAHDAEIERRYPYYGPWIGAVAKQRGTPLAQALSTARRAVTGLRLAFDATSLGPHLVGTQRVAVEIASALARHPSVAELSLVVAAGPRSDYLARALANAPRVRWITDRPQLALEADVAYRPAQAWSTDDISRLRRWGERTVLQQLDLIAYDNPAYFPDAAQWMLYRDVTRFALAAVDAVAFSSAHAEQEARAAGLIPGDVLTRVTANGLDHTQPQLPAVPPAPPAGRLEPRFVLCFGTDYAHKNRGFTLATFAAMCARGYAGQLVLAGPRVRHGSSAADEARFFERHPQLRERVVVLGEVSESERLWLYRAAELVLYPSVYEGFGLVPFEAARLGTPCLCTRLASLDEVLPPGIDVITDFEPERVARQALDLLATPERRAALVAALAARAGEFTWGQMASELVTLFMQVVERAARPEVLALRCEGGMAPRSMAPLPVLTKLEGMYPPEIYEALRAIGQRRALRRSLSVVLGGSYRAVSSLNAWRIRRA